MKGTDIKVDYEQLEETARLLDSSSQRTEETLKILQRSFDALIPGGWQGEGASKFNDEMDEQIIPRLKRLEDALGQGGKTIREISRVFYEAEDLAANVMNGGGLSGAFLGGVMAGLLGQGNSLDPINGIPNGSWKDWWGNGNKTLKLLKKFKEDFKGDLPDWLSKGEVNDRLQALWLKSGGALKLNQYLLDHNPAAKQALMKALRTGAITELLGMGADIAFAKDGNEALLQLGGGFTKAGVSYFLKDTIGSTGVGAIGQLVDGAVKFGTTGERSDLIAGGIKAGISLTPQGRIVLLANGAVQFVGGGVGSLVHAGSDFLSNGDPALAEGFRTQSDAFQSHLKNMDVEKLIDTSAKGIDKVLNGDVQGGLHTFGEGLGTMGNGIANTTFEGGKMFWSVTGSMYEKVTGQDTSDFVRTAQNLSWDDVKTTSEYAIHEAGDAVKDLGNTAQNALEDLGQGVNKLTDKLGGALQNFHF